MVICYWIVKHHLRCFALQFQSNLLRFIRFRTSSIQRLLENSCAFNLLHTLSTSTGGVRPLVAFQTSRFICGNSTQVLSFKIGRASCREKVYLSLVELSLG